jgi:hypothetical protein
VNHKQNILIGFQGHNTIMLISWIVIDHDDWSVRHSICIFLNELWDKCTIDRFASDYNNHQERLNFNVWYPETEQTAAFSKVLENDMNWLVPPPSLITKALSKLRQDKAKAILIIPCMEFNTLHANCTEKGYFLWIHWGDLLFI